MANILLIEPDSLLAETYRQALEAAGHKVNICAGAQVGIMLADKVKPEIVIIELQLVEHSGIEFLYEFRSYGDWQNIPVLVQSHVPPSEFADNLPLLKEQLGVKEYLYKPQTSLKRLIAAVGEQLAVKA